MTRAYPPFVSFVGCCVVAVACSQDPSSAPSGSSSTGSGAPSAGGSMLTTTASTSSTATGGVVGSAGNGGNSGAGNVNSDAGADVGSPMDDAASGSAGRAGAGGAGVSDGGPNSSSDAGSTRTDGGTTVPPGGYGTSPITECSTPSLDRLQQWTAHANTTPATGNLLVKEGARYVARVSFPGGGVWSEVVVPVNNDENIPGDLSMSAGFTITYSATADFWGQLRGTVQPHGGDQNVVKLPATGGNMSTLSFRFVQEDWTFVPALGRPTVTLASVIKSAVFFDFAGNTANTVAFYDLRFDNYLPQCR